jgi:hypothetical protein
MNRAGSHGLALNIGRAGILKPHHRQVATVPAAAAAAAAEVSSSSSSPSVQPQLRPVAAVHDQRCRPLAAKRPAYSSTGAAKHLPHGVASMLFVGPHTACLQDYWSGQTLTTWCGLYVVRRATHCCRRLKDMGRGENVHSTWLCMHCTVVGFLACQVSGSQPPIQGFGWSPYPLALDVKDRRVAVVVHMQAGSSLCVPAIGGPSLSNSN